MLFNRNTGRLGMGNLGIALIVLLSAAVSFAAPPATQPATQPVKSFTTLQNLMKESGEPFPGPKVGTWTPVKLDAVNGRLAGTVGSRLDLQKFRVVEVREIKNKKNQQYGKWVVTGIERVGPDCFVEVQAFFDQKATETLKLDTLKEGRLVDLGGMILYNKLTEVKNDKRGEFMVSLGVQVDKLVVPK
jgi:hypothetical protein